MKTIILFLLIVCTVIYSEEVEVKLKNGVTHTGKLLNCGDNDLFIKSNKINRPISFNFSTIEYVIVEGKKTEGDITKSKIMDILKAVKLDKSSMYIKKQEEEEKQRADKLNQLKLEAQKRIEEQEIQRLRKVELFKSGDYKLFVACPSCGTLNYQEDKMCLKCNKAIVFNLEKEKDLQYFNKTSDLSEESMYKFHSLGTWHRINGSLLIVISGVGIITTIISAASLEDWTIGHTFTLISVGLSLSLGIWEVKIGSKLIK